MKFLTGSFRFLLVGTLIISPVLFHGAAISLASRPAVNTSASSVSLLRPATESVQMRVQAAYGKLPLSFEINQGQADSSVKFLSCGTSYGFYLSANDSVFALKNNSSSAATSGAASSATLKLRLHGANASPHMEGLDELPGKTNYLVGNDPAQWRRGIPNYAKVKYQQVWSGIDLIFYGNQQQLEYDFIVSPGADPRTIQFSFEGAQRLRLADNGDLIIQTAAGEVRQRRPVIYQEVKGERREVTGGYVVKRNNRISFQTGRYDRQLPLIIDPILAWIASGFSPASVAVDSQGQAYVLGSDYPAGPGTSGAYQLNTAGNGDFQIAKLNAAGTALVYRTFLGGSDFEREASIAVDSSGAVTLVGTTLSTDFPVRNPLQAYRGQNALYRSDDRAVTWSVSSQGLGKVVNGFGFDARDSRVVYAGTSQGIFKSTDNGLTWQKISNVSVSNLIVTSTNPPGFFTWRQKEILKSTDEGRTWVPVSSSLPLTGGVSVGALTVDPRNPAVLYAGLRSPLNLYKSTDGGNTWAVVSSVPSAGATPAGINRITIAPSDSQIVYLTTDDVSDQRLNFKSVNGGSAWTTVGENSGRVVAIDPFNAENILLGDSSGLLRSTNGGTSWTRNATIVGFIGSIVFDPKTAGVVYAQTVIGIYKSTNSGETWVQASSGLPESPRGNIFVNPANSTVYVDTRYIQPSECVVTKLNPAGSDLVFSTFLGGSGEDAAKAVALDAAGNTYITGAASADFPVTSGVWQSRYGGGDLDAFVAKLNSTGTSLSWSTYIGGNSTDVGQAIAVDKDSNATITGYTSSGNFPLSSDALIRAQSAGFVVRLNAAGSAPVYSTFTGTAQGTAIVVDADGNAYLAGSSLGFSTGGPGPLAGGFVRKINPSGSAFVYSFDFPSAGIRSIALDADRNVWLTGEASVSGFPITNDAYQKEPGGGSSLWGPVVSPFCFVQGRPCLIPYRHWDAFLARLNPSGTALTYSTYLGAGAIDSGAQVTVDSTGKVYLTGTGVIAATSGAISGAEGFIARFDPATTSERNAVLTSVSAASYERAQLAQESIVAAFGLDIATISGGEEIRVKDSAGTERLAYPFFISPSQINFQIPPGTAPGLASISVVSGGTPVSIGTAQIVSVAPGVFSANASARGVAAALITRVKKDGSQVIEPVARYDTAQAAWVAVPIVFTTETDKIFLSLFGTGWRNFSNTSAVSVTIGGTVVPLQYVGKQPTLIGLDQINAEIPRTLAGRGDAEVAVTVDSKNANPVRVTIQ